MLNIRFELPLRVVPTFLIDHTRYVVLANVLYRLDPVPQPAASQIIREWETAPDPDEREVEPDHDMQLEELWLRQQDERGER